MQRVKVSFTLVLADDVDPWCDWLVEAIANNLDDGEDIQDLEIDPEVKNPHLADPEDFKGLPREE